MGEELGAVLESRRMFAEDEALRGREGRVERRPVQLGRRFRDGRRDPGHLAKPPGPLLAEVHRLGKTRVRKRLEVFHELGEPTRLARVEGGRVDAKRRAGREAHRDPGHRPASQRAPPHSESLRRIKATTAFRALRSPDGEAMY